MANAKALEIVRQLRRDQVLLTELPPLLQSEQYEKILSLLQQRGISADKAALLSALDIHWAIGELSDTSPPATTDGKFDLRLKLQQGLARVVEQIDRGYERALVMYTVAFYLGIGLVIASVYAALVQDSTKAAAVLGGLGMADVLASLIFRPAQEVQNSRGNLAQLQAAFFSWFNDVYNWNEYLGLLDREAKEKKQIPTFDRLKEVSEAQMRNVERMMSLIEEFCETRSTPLQLKKVKTPDPKSGADKNVKPPADSDE